MINRRKKILLGVMIAVVSLTILAGSVLSAMIFYPNSDYFGLNRIRKKGNGDIVIFCSEYVGYDVATVSPDATVYRGEQLVPLNTDLGEHILVVRLGDAVVSNRFSHTYSPWVTYQLEDADCSFMYAYTADHGVDVYIGSDKPIDEQAITVIGLNHRLFAHDRS